MKFPTYEEMVKMAQNVAEKMLDEYEYKGKTLRQWIEIISASELGTNLAEVGTDCISRQQAIDYFVTNVGFHDEDGYPIEDTDELRKIWTEYFDGIPSAQPEVIRCKDCIYYDPPHVENNGVRYEYDEMQADAFDALGTGLVTAEYGINIGGRCCVDYYCKNYSDDKRVFVREDNYCGRAERRTDE